MRQSGPPRWTWQDVLHVKPGDSAERGIQPNDRFVRSIERQIEEYETYLRRRCTRRSRSRRRQRSGLWTAWGAQLLAKARGEDMIRKGTLRTAAGESSTKESWLSLFPADGLADEEQGRAAGRRTADRAAVLRRVQFLADGDHGRRRADVAIQRAAGRRGQHPAEHREKADGTLVAYMRDNGPPPQRLHVSSSSDKGLTWSPVRDSELPNPGSGADIVTLRNGHWVLAYNDTEKGRHSLAVSLSTDEGKTWSHTRHLEHSDSEEGARPPPIRRSSRPQTAACTSCTAIRGRRARPSSTHASPRPGCRRNSRVSRS